MSQTVEMHIIAADTQRFSHQIRLRGKADWRTYRRVLYSSRNTATRMRCAASRVSLTCGSSGSFRQLCVTAGHRPCARPSWAATSASACLRRARRSGRTRSGCPRCALTAWSPTRRTVPVLHISGADLMDGTPIFDIKPYLAYTDSHPEARGGFALTTDAVRVECPASLLEKLPQERRQTLLNVLAQRSESRGTSTSRAACTASRLPDLR